MKLGNLKRLSPRSVWRDEARDFTPWLAAHVDFLSEALGMELEIVGTEEGVGSFSADIVAKDLGTGGLVIIENQFGTTDHDHLGKVMTYAAGLDARAVVWIAESIRDEHRQAVEWINQRTGEDTAFFAVVLELLQIDDSQPAPSFNLVVTPNEWRKQTQRAKTEPSERGEAYRVFFQELIDILREKHRFTNARVGQPQNWYSFSSGYSGIYYAAAFGMGHTVRAEVYIDRGDADENLEVFRKLDPGGHPNSSTCGHPKIPHPVLS